jgi:hypothetical protein
MSIQIWVKITGADAESITSVRCDSFTTIDDLKNLVRLKCSPDLDHIGAYRLVVKGADGELIEEDTPLSERSEGRNKSTAFVVEVPAAAAAAATTGMFNFNLMDKKKKDI